MKNPNPSSHSLQKNTLIGFVLGVIVTATLGATLTHYHEVGRFQIAAGDGNTAYVIDTVSGQVWSRIPSAPHYAKEFEKPKAEGTKQP